MSKINNKKKKIPFLYKVVALLLLIITIFLIWSIICLNVLNFLLLILVIALIIVISGLSILLLSKSRIKKVGLGLSIILILIFGLLFSYIDKTNGLINNLNLTYKTYNYSIVVRKNSSYTELNDLLDRSVGYYNDGSAEVDKALNKIAKKIDIEDVGYEDTHSLANSLLEGELDAILIENSYLDILDESVIYENASFKDNIKELYDFAIVINTSNIAKDINVTQEPFNIYVSGIDTFGEISSVSRSDVNMVISVNPDTRNILLTSIPRDYYVSLHGKTGYRDKLTHAGLYGTDMSIQTLEDLLDIEINYYVKVNFSSVIDIVDAIGGIEVYSDYDFTSIDNYNYSKGYNKVNGEEALSFARERKAFLAGDRQRVKNQQAVFKAMFDKCTSKDIITKYNRLLDSLMGSLVTNMPTARMTSLVRMQLADNYAWNIKSNSLNGSDSSNYTYSAPNQKAYVMIPDEESVMEAKKLIKILENNESEDISLNDENNSDKDLSDTNETVFKESDNQTTANLKVKLARPTVTLIKGDEYIYHGYSATYDGIDITNDSKLIEKFSIDNETFDNYRDLVRYVTYNLEPGNHTIIYNITYKEETNIVKQTVIIEDLEQIKNN